MQRQCEDLEADEAELNGKIKKKKADLERGEKRLKSLQASFGRCFLLCNTIGFLEMPLGEGGALVDT